MTVLLNMEVQSGQKNLRVGGKKSARKLAQGLRRLRPAVQEQMRV